jgi:hypothetical protein
MLVIYSMVGDQCLLYTSPKPFLRTRRASIMGQCITQVIYKTKTENTPPIHPHSGEISVYSANEQASWDPGPPPRHPHTAAPWVETWQRATSPWPSLCRVQHRDSALNDINTVGQWRKKFSNSSRECSIFYTVRDVANLYNAEHRWNWTNYFHGIHFILRSWQTLSWSRNSLPFMKSWRSLTCSQEPTEAANSEALCNKS